jgi:hypothetical protein
MPLGVKINARTAGWRTPPMRAKRRDLDSPMMTPGGGQKSTMTVCSGLTPILRARPRSNSGSGYGSIQASPPTLELGKPMDDLKRPLTSSLSDRRPEGLKLIGTSKSNRLTIYDWKNVALPVSYFLVGLIPAIQSTPLTIYMVQTLNATPGQQNSLAILIATPFTIKVAIGFLSDTFPICGQRRKPYFIIGYLLCIPALVCLALLGLSVLIFISALGQLIADVMADTMVVERAKLEAEESRGSFQSACYAIRFTGGE